MVADVYIRVFLDNPITDLLVVADHHYVAVCCWSLYIEERKIETNSIFIGWSVKAAVLASVLVYVLVGSHVSLNDTMGWGSISDKVEEHPDTSRALRVPVDFCRKSRNFSRCVVFCNCSFFCKMSITWATTSNNERKVNKIRNLQIFLLRKNTQHQNEGIWSF